VEKPEQEDLNDVLSAIRNMVRDETRAKFSETATPPTQLKKVKPKVVKRVVRQPNLPAKILILHPHMRVKKAKPEPLILDKTSRVPHDTPNAAGESFAVANPLMDEGLLRDMVREVVQEQLRGEFGKEIIGAIKRDMVQLLEKKR
jgi:hypothetical protein